jgi:DNA repair photolyase
VSVPCVDEDVWRSLEPGTAHPLQRLRAVRELVDAGIDAGVLMAPIVPGISSKPSLIERTIKAAADHGARVFGANVMHLEGGTRDHFMRWLAHEYPHLVEGYQKLYVGKYAPAGYRDEVKKVVAAVQKKAG